MYEEITDWITSKMPGYDSENCKMARAAFNSSLTAKGGMAFGSSGNSANWYYLSSSEVVSTRSYSFNLEDGQYSMDEKNIDVNIRWIRDF